MPPPGDHIRQRYLHPLIAERSTAAGTCPSQSPTPTLRNDPLTLIPIPRQQLQNTPSRTSRKVPPKEDLPVNLYPLRYREYLPHRRSSRRQRVHSESARNVVLPGVGDVYVFLHQRPRRAQCEVIRMCERKILLAGFAQRRLCVPEAATPHGRGGIHHAPDKDLTYLLR